MKSTPPLERLAAEPEIASLADVGRGLEELAWIDAEERRLLGECQRQETALRRTYEERMQLEVEGERVAFVVRRVRIEEAIAAWAEENRSAVLDGSDKSRKFTHGTIGWRKSPDAVSWIPGHSEKTLRDTLEKAHKLFSKIGAVLGKCFPFRKKPGSAVPAEQLFEVRLSPNKVAIKEFLAQGKVGEPQLRDLGLELSPGPERFYLDVAKQAVRTESDDV